MSKKKSTSSVIKRKLNAFKSCYPNQLRISEDCNSGKFRIVVVKSGRQTGKSYIADRVAINWVLKLKNIQVLWLTPKHSISLDAYERIFNICDGKFNIDAKASPDDRRITFLDTNSHIKFRTASGEDSLRGSHPNKMILDEFAFISQDTWELAVEPYFISEPGLVCLLVSTPCGANHFYKEYLKGFSDKYPRHSSHELHYSMNPHAQLDVIEEKRKDLIPSVFQQEYEGEFIFGNSTVFGTFNTSQVIEKYSDNYNEPCWFGLDCSATGNDKTILTIINEHNEVVFIHENKTSMPVDQANEIINVLKKYNNIKGYCEDNSMGIAMYDMIRRGGINVIRWYTSNTSKQELVTGLNIALNNKEIKIPTSTLCPELDSEMSVFVASRTRRGKVTYGHPDGAHDDYVDSLMMAYKAFKDMKSSGCVIKQRLDIYSNGGRNMSRGIGYKYKV